MHSRWSTSHSCAASLATGEPEGGRGRQLPYRMGAIGVARIFAKLAGAQWLTLRRAWQAAVLAAFALTTAVGGMKATGQTAPVLGLGDTYRGPYLTVSVDRVIVTDRLPWWVNGLADAGRYADSQMPAEPGHRYLAVAATLTNTWSRPQSNVDDYVFVQGVAGIPPHGRAEYVYRRDDHTPYAPESVALQPNLATPVAFVWQVATDAVSPGSAVTVEIATMARQEDTKIGYGGTFLPPEVAATVKTSVQDGAP